MVKIEFIPFFKKSAILKMQSGTTRNKEITVIWIASLVGLVISGYLSYVKLFHAPIYCTPGLGDCATVNASQWSLLWGIPIAVLGMLSYLAVLLLIFLGPRIEFVKTFSRQAIFGISLFGFLFSMYLTYLELFIIKTMCQWCVISAISMTVIFIASIFSIKRSRL